MAQVNVAGTQTGVNTTSGVKGITRQYQVSGVLGTGTVAPFDSGTILGTVPPGQPGIKLIDGTIQRSTDPLVSGQLATNQADNFAASTTGVGLVPTVNPAQVASAGKSLSPQHE
jgi:hypothetical protein